MKKRVVAFRSMTLVASIEVSFTSTVTYSEKIQKYNLVCAIDTTEELILTVVGFGSSLQSLYDGCTAADMVRYN